MLLRQDTVLIHYHLLASSKLARCHQEKKTHMRKWETGQTSVGRTLLSNNTTKNTELNPARTPRKRLSSVMTCTSTLGTWCSYCVCHFFQIYSKWTLEVKFSCSFLFIWPGVFLLFFHDFPLQISLLIYRHLFKFIVWKVPVRATKKC